MGNVESQFRIERKILLGTCAQSLTFMLSPKFLFLFAPKKIYRRRHNNKANYTETWCTVIAPKMVMKIAYIVRFFNYR